MAGMKDDAGKARFDLLPPLALKEVAMILTGGCYKYEEESWRGVPDLEKRYDAAAKRHMSKHQLWERGSGLPGGSQIDPDMNCHHLAHAICCLMFKLELELEKLPSVDERFQRPQSVRDRLRREDQERPREVQNHVSNQ